MLASLTGSQLLRGGWPAAGVPGLGPAWWILPQCRRLRLTRESDSRAGAGAGGGGGGAEAQCATGLRVRPCRVTVRQWPGVRV